MPEKNNVNDLPAIELKIELAHLGNRDVARAVFDSLAKAFSATADNLPSHNWEKSLETALGQNLRKSLNPAETSLVTVSYQRRSDDFFVSDKVYEDYLFWDSVAGLDDDFDFSPRCHRRDLFDDDDWLSADD